MLTDKTVFAPGESIPFRLELVNSSTSDARPVSLGTNGKATRITVQNQAGNTVFSLDRDEAAYGRGETVAVPGIDPHIELDPGQRDEATFDVQTLQILNVPGRYRLEAQHAWDDVELVTETQQFEIRAAQVDAAVPQWLWVDTTPAMLHILVRDLGVWQLRRTDRAPELILSSHALPSIPRDAALYMASMSTYDSRDRDAVLWMDTGELRVQFVQDGREEPGTIRGQLPPGDWDLLPACAHAHDDVTCTLVREDTTGKTIARGRFDPAGARQEWDELRLDAAQAGTFAVGMTLDGRLYVAHPIYNAERDETTVEIQTVPAGDSQPRRVGVVHGPAQGLRFYPGTGSLELRLVVLTRSKEQDDVFRYGVIDPVRGEVISGERALSLEAPGSRLRQWEIDEESALVVLYEFQGRPHVAHVEGPRAEALPPGVDATPPVTMIVAPEGYVFCYYNAGSSGMSAHTVLQPPGELE